MVKYDFNELEVELTSPGACVKEYKMKRGNEKEKALIAVAVFVKKYKNNGESLEELFPGLEETYKEVVNELEKNPTKYDKATFEVLCGVLISVANSTDRKLPNIEKIRKKYCKSKAEECEELAEELLERGRFNDAYKEIREAEEYITKIEKRPPKEMKKLREKIEKKLERMYKVGP